MGLFGWFKGKPDAGTRAWRDQWHAAVATLDAAAVGPLDAALRRQPPLADDLEIEQEMLDGLRQLLALQQQLAAGGRAPLVETSHRVVGGDACHYSAPVSMPDDPAQPTGRLLLTSTRAVFAGASRAPAMPWHGVREVLQNGRDLLFITNRAGEDEAQRFRCNSFGEALCGAAIARFLARQSRQR
jgi:hypothetical protein